VLIARRQLLGGGLAFAGDEAGGQDADLVEDAHRQGHQRNGGPLTFLTYLRHAASGLSTVIDPPGHTTTHTCDARTRRTTERAARRFTLDRMSDVTYSQIIRPPDNPLVWLHGVVKSPPLSNEDRLRAGVLLRRLQRGEVLYLPDARPMRALVPRCHELRLRDTASIGRLISRIDTDAIVLLDVFQKKTPKTPQRVLDACRQRLRNYEAG
jgi:YD repeat-containing protein